MEVVGEVEEVGVLELRPSLVLPLSLIELEFVGKVEFFEEDLGSILLVDENCALTDFIFINNYNYKLLHWISLAANTQRTIVGVYYP